MRKGIIAFIALFSLSTFFPSTAAADDCKPLARITQVTFKREDGSARILVPVQINGKDRYMLFDTGGFFSMISGSTVKALDLPTKTTNVDLIGVSGNSAADGSGKGDDRLSHVATADTFSIGRMRWDKVDFFVAANDSFQGTDGPGAEVGVLSPNLLKDFDVDIDYGNNTFSVMSADHCPGRVIYWKAAAVAVVPFYFTKDWHMAVSVNVDGQNFNAAIDTGATTSTMDLQAAEARLNVVPGSADTPAVDKLGSNEGDLVYRHRFHLLSLNGIAVSNPELMIFNDEADKYTNPGPALGSRFNAEDPRDTTNMLIGADILSHFHLYIAYKEQKLYITPATAPAAKQ